MMPSTCLAAVAVLANTSCEPNAMQGDKQGESAGKTIAAGAACTSYGCRGTGLGATEKDTD